MLMNDCSLVFTVHRCLGNTVRHLGTSSFDMMPYIHGYRNRLAYARTRRRYARFGRMIAARGRWARSYRPVLVRKARLMRARYQKARFLRLRRAGLARAKWQRLARARAARARWAASYYR